MAEKWQFVFILWFEGYDKTPAGTVRDVGVKHQKFGSVKLKKSREIETKNATPSKQSAQRAFLTGKLATNPPELVFDLLLDREDCFPTGLTLCNFMRPWSAMRHASLSDDSLLICINTSSRPSSTISSLRVKNKNNHKKIITKIFAFRSSFTWSLKFYVIPSIAQTGYIRAEHA